MHDRAHETRARTSPTTEPERATAAPQIATLLRLQQSAGNWVVQRYLASRTQDSEEPGVRDRIESAALGGASLPSATRDELQSGLGVDLSHVRLHTGGEANRLARSLNAVAFTYGPNIFLRGDAPDAGSDAGKHLLRHEAVHTIQQSAGTVSGSARTDGLLVSEPSDRYERAADEAATALGSGDHGRARELVSWTAPGAAAIQRITDEALAAKADADAQKADTDVAAKRPLDFITMKRKNIHLTGEDKYGHWWTEMDGAESYGWWPKRPVGLWATLTGTEGELNGQTSFGGSATKDPHHGDSAEEEFHPKLTGSKTDDQVRTEVRAYATGYSGSWRWTFGFGQNCHTFQKGLMAQVGMTES